MIQLFAPLLTWIAGSFLARVLVGAGLSIASLSFVGGLIDSALTNVQSIWGGLPGSIAAILGLSGFGSALSLVGGAVVARGVIVSAGILINKVSA